MEGEIAELKPYICDSNDALEFKLVRYPEDLENDSTTFKPEMSHQVFDNEMIFGYKRLKVKLYYAAGNLDTYLGMSYSEKINKIISANVDLEDILKKVSEKIAPNPHTNIDEFVKNLEKDLTFRPEGKLLSSFSIDDNGKQRQFEIYQADMTNKKFKDYNERLQTFLLWYIDAASFTDPDDTQWYYFNLFEKFKGDTDNSIRYATVGFATVYQYYAFPEHIRPRIAQILILPPFQKKGLGCHLLRAIYNEYIPQERVKDITVEDPSENFQRLRDYVDCINCSKLPSFSNDKLMQGFQESMANEACKNYKINKKQARRVYEILRLKATNVHNDDEYRQYRLNVKNRLNCTFKKEDIAKKKLEAVLKCSGSSSSSLIDAQTEANSALEDEKRIQYLEREYRYLVERYNQVINRLNAD